MCELWGSREIAQVMFPADDERLIEWGIKWQRNSISPDAIPRFYDMLEHSDVRQVLPTIRVPTLVMHRKGDLAVPIENSRYIANAIPGAKLVELEGDQHLPFLGDWDAVQDEVEEFLVGERSARRTDRVLATILMSDIVDSTERAQEMGDAHWRRMLDNHDEIARDLLDRWQGRLIKNTGDGLLATFDGPARAIRCAASLRDELRSLGLEIRLGLHTGEVEMRGDDVGGIAVHIGARVVAAAGPGELLVSESVPPLVAGSGIEFEPRGTHELKGVPGDWRLFAVAG
jgi:class 3 adenylate cyclase